MQKLKDCVAVVAGASRGAGRGIALALGDAGATVYVTGRTTRDGAKPKDGAPGTIEDTAEEVTARGGTGIPVQTDFTDEASVAALFQRVEQEHGKIDVLANAVYGGHDAYESPEEWAESWEKPFWERPLLREWDSMMMAGPYAYLTASMYAARLMADAGKGLIVGVTDGILGTEPDSVLDGSANVAYQGALLWDLSHQCISRLLLGMSADLRDQNVAVVPLMPGFMQTERVKMSMKTEEDEKTWRFDLSESVEYIGRAVAALAADEKVMEKSGRIHFVADLAQEYGFADVDGRQIPRFRPFD